MYKSFEDMNLLQIIEEYSNRFRNYGQLTADCWLDENFAPGYQDEVCELVKDCVDNEGNLKHLLID